MLEHRPNEATEGQDGARRLLVISYHFPPDGSVGGLRWAGFSKYLARRGWEVHVVTAAMGGDVEVEPGIIVHCCPRKRTLNDFYRETIVRRRQPKLSPQHASGEGPVHGGRPPHPVSQPFTWIRRTVGATLSFPDVGRGWMLRAAFKARDLLREKRFRALVSSGPPHSVHLAAIIARAGNKIPFWMDMRDPWHEPALMHGTREFDGTHRIIRALESRAVRAATRVVVNTSAFSKRMREEYPDAQISVVTNGIDRESLPRPALAKFEGLSVAYAGTLYFNRDLAPVVRGLAEFADRHPEARGGVKLRVAGNVDPEHLARFWSEVDAAKLRDAVEVYGPLPRADALDLLNRSHLALVLAQDQHLMIPAKLYECVAMRLPTLVLTENGSAAAQEAGRIGGIVCDPTDVGRIRRVFETLWDDKTSFRPDTVDFGYDLITDEVEALLLGTSDMLSRDEG